MPGQLICCSGSHYNVPGIHVPPAARYNHSDHERAHTHANYKLIPPLVGGVRNVPRSPVQGAPLIRDSKGRTMDCYVRPQQRDGGTSQNSKLEPVLRDSPDVADKPRGHTDQTNERQAGHRKRTKDAMETADPSEPYRHAWFPPAELSWSFSFGGQQFAAHPAQRFIPSER